MERLCVFVPAYNVAGTIGGLIGEFKEVRAVLARREVELELHIIDDASTDPTQDLVTRLVSEKPWIKYLRHPTNRGNAANIELGYSWGTIAEADIIGCMDADGEHSPYALLRHLNYVIGGLCDGVVGSIIFPEHEQQNLEDRNMMRFCGGMQSKMAGIDGRFYIQSPGYNLHRTAKVARALELLPEYRAFFAAERGEPFPRWGMHGVMIHLMAQGASSNIKAAYLECFGTSPNRTPDKLQLQAAAAMAHAAVLPKFLARYAK